MTTILELKQNLQDVRNDLRAAEQKGVELAQNRNTEYAELKAQSDKIDDLQIREALMKQELEKLENEGKPKPRQDAPKSAFSSFGDFALAVRNATVHNVRDERLYYDAATGANETTSADGGYLVPPEYADGVLDLVRGESVLYPQAAARAASAASAERQERPRFVCTTTPVQFSTGRRLGRSRRFNS